MLPGVFLDPWRGGIMTTTAGLDILIAGLMGYDEYYNPIVISSVYHNNGDGSFSLNTNAVLPGVYWWIGGVGGLR